MTRGNTTLERACPHCKKPMTYSNNRDAFRCENENCSVFWVKFAYGSTAIRNIVLASSPYPGIAPVHRNIIRTEGR